MKEIQKLRAVIAELKYRNRLGNDRDAYLFHLAEWALSERDNKPIPEDYGLISTRMINDLYNN